jgi:urease accessory protein
MAISTMIMDMIARVMNLTTATTTSMACRIVMPATSMSGKKKNVPLLSGRTIRIRSAPATAASSRLVAKDVGTGDPPSGDDEMAASAALYRLMTWLSPSYPVGAFSFSSGIEWAVEVGDIADAASLQRWLTAMIVDGSGFCDCVFLCHAHQAAADASDSRLREVAGLSAVFVPSRERHLETTAQGGAFLEATRAAWPCAAIERLASAWDGLVTYPVAVGVAAAGHGVACAPALQAYLHATLANWISAGVRLVPLGQTDGQRILAALESVVANTVLRALKTPLDQVGSSTFRSDLASMRHETQYTRLFRS